MKSRADILVARLKAALCAHFPVKDGCAQIDIHEALEALGSCQAYLIAGAQAGDRQRLLAWLDDELPTAISRIIAKRNPIVGTAIEVRREP